MAEDWSHLGREDEFEENNNGPKKSETVNRRQFVTAIVAATAGSVGTGAALAVINGRQSASIVATPPPVPTTDFSPVIQAAESAQQELVAQLAAAQAENMRLQSELDATVRRLQIAEQSIGTTSDEATLLRAELASVNQRTGILAGLVTLYEQLDDVDLSDVVSGGIEQVSSRFGELIEEVPTLSEALAEGEALLDQFEEQVPVLAAGRDWLEDRLANLSGVHARVEQMLQLALDRIAPVLEMLDEWFTDILSWLPFGMGGKAQGVMTALTSLMQETPEMIQSVQVNVSLPLAGWFKPAEGERDPVIQAKLFQPMREKAIATGRRGLGMVESVQASYENELVAQVSARLSDRQIVQELITQYRTEHQLERGMSQGDM